MSKTINKFINFIRQQSQPNEDPQIKEKLNDLLYKEEVLGERRVNRINLVMFLLFFLTMSSVAFSTGFSAMNIFNFIGIFSYLIYNLVMFFILRSSFYKPFFKFITVSFNVSIVFFIAMGYSFTDNGWLYTVRTVTLLAVFLAIIMSGFYHRPGMVIFSSALAVFGYTFLALFVIITHKVALSGEETFNKPLYSIDLLITYDIAFILAGILVAIICRQLKILLGRTLNTEAEKFNIEKAKEEVEITSRIKTNLFINLSHETKTPLTLISNYMDKYIKQYGMNDDLYIIKQNIDKLLRDMVNYLDIEKLERGQVFYNNDQVFNVSDLLNKKMPFLKTLAERKNINFKSKIEDDLYIKADPLAIDRIINNLVDNAVKFTNENGIVDVSLDSDSSEIIFIVSDNGIGISEEHKINIFQPYYQIAHEKRNIQGSGMGLYIVKKITDSINGRIVLESSLEHGSKFSVFFKKIVPEMQDIIQTKIEFTAPVDSIPLKMPLNDPVKIRKELNSILVVEDNINMLQYLISNLENEYNVFPTVSGNKALEKLKIIPAPDIIISDVMMDDMDGYTFFEKLMKIEGNDNRQVFREIPFIFLTAMNSQNEKIKSLVKGAVDFISKPFLIDELKAKIRNLLKMRDVLRESNIREFESKLSKLIREKPEKKPLPPKKDEDVNILEKYYITAREKDVIDCIIEGLDNNKISEKLFISLNTVKRHIQNIYEKCGVKNKIELFNLIKSKNEKSP